MRASAPNALADDPVLSTVVLVGQSGETELFSGPLKQIASLIELPVTLPGERLVLRATKQAKLAFEVSWVQHGPTEEEDPCAR